MTYRPFGIMRFVLAMMVCTFHAGYVLPKEDHWFFFETGFGVIAVMVFFVISGFVIAEANCVFYADRPGAFLLNRALRLAPPYFAALALAAIVQQWLFIHGRLALWDGILVGSPLQGMVLLAGALDIVPFFRPDYIGAQNVHFIPFSWSLRVEFAFYLFVGASLLIAHLLPARRTSVLRIAAIAAYLGFLLFVATGRGPKQIDIAPFFGFGIAMFALAGGRSGLNWLHVGFTSIALVVAFSVWEQQHSPVLAYQLALLAALLAIFVWLIFRSAPSRRFKVIDTRLGDLSYPLYLNHFIVVLAIQNSTTDYGWPLYAAAIAGSLALSFVMLRLVETPMRGIRQRVRGAPIGPAAVDRRPDDGLAVSRHQPATGGPTMSTP